MVPSAASYDDIETACSNLSYGGRANPIVPTALRKFQYIQTDRATNRESVHPFMLVTGTEQWVAFEGWPAASHDDCIVGER
jgi:hypothetical protein